MLQYLPPIAQCTKKVRHTLNNYAAFVEKFQNVSEYYGASRNEG